MVIAELKDASNGQTVGVLMAQPKDFKTGSRGFYGTGKAEIQGKRYQINVQLVEIGSKPKAEDKPTESAA